MVAEGNETLTRTAHTAKEIAANANFLSTRYGMTNHQVQDTMRECGADKAGMLKQAFHMGNIATAQQNRLPSSISSMVATNKATQA